MSSSFRLKEHQKYFVAIDFGNYQTRMAVSRVMQKLNSDSIIYTPSFYSQNELPSNMQDGRFADFNNETSNLSIILNNARGQITDESILEKPLVLVGGRSLISDFRSVDCYISNLPISPDGTITAETIKFLKDEVRKERDGLSTQIHRENCYHFDILNYALYENENDEPVIVWENDPNEGYNLKGNLKIKVNCIFYFIESRYTLMAKGILNQAGFVDAEPIYIPNIFATKEHLSNLDAKDGAIILDLGKRYLTVTYVKNNKIHLNMINSSAGFDVFYKKIAEELCFPSTIGVAPLREHCRKHDFIYFRENRENLPNEKIIFKSESSYTKAKTVEEYKDAIHSVYKLYAKNIIKITLKDIKKHLAERNCKMSGDEMIYLMGGGFDVDNIVDIFKEAVPDHYFKKVEHPDCGLTEPLSKHDALTGALLYQYKETLPKEYKKGKIFNKNDKLLQNFTENIKKFWKSKK